ncbi:myosin regulatory light chain smooth muscle isoform [Vairimorpha apis BRL 01]|uniref:Myosin regulatory light chain smooth muscle isoform n=1 Tax=Vairimorpha apis BRL 01 TaxID=1037528 RepID=T0L3A0_9MICR|nr:myosin regulatory light chain smooth muscle isoform [Vairimorpha apis BRL 01]
MQRRNRRQNSNIFHMLGKNQIVELRETFSMIDSNSDGMISKEDLIDFLNSIGNPFTLDEISNMMSEMGGSFSFMTFITMVSEKLCNTDTEADIRTALSKFEDEKELRKWLKDDENGINDTDIDILLRGCLTNGKINVNKLTSKIKFGEILNE